MTGLVARDDPAADGRRALVAAIGVSRRQLEGQLEGATAGLLAELPPALHALSLRHFLQLSDLLAAAEHGATDGRATRKRTIVLSARPAKRASSIAALAALRTERRVRRSIAHGAAASPAPPARTSQGALPSLPGTPKFHPGLPETPMALRASRRRKNTLAPPSTPGAASTARSLSSLLADPLAGGRLSHSTIRSTILSSSTAARAGKENGGAVPPATPQPHPKGGGANFVSLEVDDGSILDIDLRESPSKLAARLGQDSIREMKAKMQAYADQLRDFFKKLKVAPP